jgi:glycosyltransferase involved in cell wall biosynthesis
VRVTFLLPVFSRAPSGGFRVVYEYANWLVRRGHQVTVVHEQWREGWQRPARHVYEIARDRWHTRRAGGLTDWLWWMALDPRVRMTMVRRFVPEAVPDGDVVVATYWTTALLLPRLSARHGRPVHLVQAREIWGVPDPDRVDGALRLELPKIAVSRHLAEELTTVGVPAERITVVPNGLDHCVFRRPEPDRPRGRRVGVLLGSSEAKDSATAVRVLAQIRARVPELRVHAFGTERRPRGLPGWAGYARGLSGAELARRVYQVSSVFLCTSVREGWGFPVAEAMACGAVPVSTRNGGVEDFCVSGHNALLADVGDVDGLAAAATAVLTDEPRRAALAAAGVDTVAGMNWAVSGEAFHRALRAALDQ